MGIRTIITFLLCITTQVFAQTKGPSIWVYNYSTDSVVLSQHSNVVRPIASITKLMTAMIALDYDSSMSRQLTLSNRAGSRLPPGKYTRRELLDAMLVRSDNAAAETLAEDYPGGRKAFIVAMTKRARDVGAPIMTFDDPTGLSRHNRATAGEVSSLIAAAAKYSVIREISVQRHVMIETRHKQKIRHVELENTNKPVLFDFDSIDVSKTGFTNSAGWCVAMRVKKSGQVWAVVVLGAKNKAHRIDTVKKLMYNHIIDSEILDVPPHEFQTN